MTKFDLYGFLNWYNPNLTHQEKLDLIEDYTYHVEESIEKEKSDLLTAVVNSIHDGFKN